MPDSSLISNKHPKGDIVNMRVNLWLIQEKEYAWFLSPQRD
jgi:hypothetical protein